MSGGPIFWTDSQEYHMVGLIKKGGLQSRKVKMPAKLL